MHTLKQHIGAKAMSLPEKTYWNRNGKYDNFANQLQALIPIEGAVENPRKNKKLEKFRKAVNCYYDLYNNGLCNRATQFAKVFGIPSRDYRMFRSSHHRYDDSLYVETEQVMDRIVIEAAIEQGFVTGDIYELA
jgi:hypothetical protein